MSSARSRVLFAAAVAFVLVAGTAVAESYTVQLASGATLLTRHRPQEASWDRNMILVLTDVGNWIAVERGEIASIVSDLHNRGFAKRIDATTVVLGWSANDYDETTAAANAQSFGPPERSYDQQQFVDPEDVSGGFPAYMPSYYSGTGGSGVFPPPNSAPQVPTPESAPPPQQ
jgi:hypothetical protein